MFCSPLLSYFPISFGDHCSSPAKVLWSMVFIVNQSIVRWQSRHPSTNQSSNKGLFLSLTLTLSPLKAHSNYTTYGKTHWKTIITLCTRKKKCRRRRRMKDEEGIKWKSFAERWVMEGNSDLFLFGCIMVSDLLAISNNRIMVKKNAKSGRKYYYFKPLHSRWPTPSPNRKHHQLSNKLLPPKTTTMTTTTTTTIRTIGMEVAAGYNDYMPAVSQPANQPTIQPFGDSSIQSYQVVSCVHKIE